LTVCPRSILHESSQKNDSSHNVVLRRAVVARIFWGSLRYSEQLVEVAVKRFVVVSIALVVFLFLTSTATNGLAQSTYATVTGFEPGLHSRCDRDRDQYGNRCRSNGNNQRVGNLARLNCRSVPERCCCAIVRDLWRVSRKAGR